MTKLTSTQVADIRDAANRGTTNAALARQYGVSAQHVGRIVAGSARMTEQEETFEEKVAKWTHEELLNNWQEVRTHVGQHSAAAHDVGIAASDTHTRPYLNNKDVKKNG